MKTCRMCGAKTTGAYLCEECSKKVEKEYEEWLQAPKKRKMKQCIICGANMSHARSYTVCSEECREVFHDIALRVRKRRMEQGAKDPASIIPAKKKNMKPLFPVLDKQQRHQKKISNLGMCEREARANGLSYGQYMALYRNPYRQKIF